MAGRGVIALSLLLASILLIPAGTVLFATNTAAAMRVYDLVSETAAADENETVTYEFSVFIEKDSYMDAEVDLGRAGDIPPPRISPTVTLTMDNNSYLMLDSHIDMIPIMAVGQIGGMRAGWHNGSLSLTFSEAGTCTVSVHLRSSDSILAANIQADMTSGTAPLAVNFTANVPGIGGWDSYSYKWDFGDGTTSSEAHPCHVYNQSGSFQVTLDATDAAFLKYHGLVFIDVSQKELNVTVTVVDPGSPSSPLPLVLIGIVAIGLVSLVTIDLFLRRKSK